MGIRRRIRKKASWEEEFTPVPTQLQTRPFGKGIQARQAVLPITNLLQTRPFGSRQQASSQESGTPDIQTQLAMAQRFGYNAANIPVLAPGKEKVKSDLDLNLAKENSLQDEVLTHNHPGGAPLHQGDVLSAVDKGIKEVRATGMYGTFVLRRTDEAWQISQEQVASAFAQGIEKWSQECPKELAEHHPSKKEIPQTGATFKQDLLMANYFACKILAEQSQGAVVYEHPNENELIEKRSKLYRDTTVISMKRILKGKSNQAPANRPEGITPQKRKISTDSKDGE